MPELISQFQQLGRDLPQLVSKVSDLLSSEPRLAQLNDAVGEGLNLKGLQPLLGFAGGAANSLIQLFLMVLLAILLALDPSAHRRMVVAMTPRPARERMEHLLDECRQALGGWLSGMTLSATTVFLLTWGGLLLLKSPLALLSALVCGLLTFVPTIGPTAATLLPTGLALLQSPQLMLSVLVFRLVLQNLEAFHAHTTAAAQNRESAANGGLNGSAQPWRSTRASGRAAGPSPGGGASGVDAARGGAADHGPLGVNPSHEMYPHEHPVARVTPETRPVCVFLRGRENDASSLGTLGRGSHFFRPDQSS